MAFKLAEAFVEFKSRGLAQVQRESSKASRSLNNAATGASNMVRALIGIGAAAGTIKLVNLASDAEESATKFEAVFKEQAKAAELFGDNLADAVGRSKVEIKGGLATFQSFFKGLDFGSGKALEFSQNLQTMAIDFASFNNLSDAEGLQRFISAMSGSGEVLDRFGINIKMAALNQKLLELGLAKSAQAATEQQKAIARMAIISESLGSQGAIGDAIRTADSYANQMKRLKGELRDTGAEIGAILLPPLKVLLKLLQSMVPFLKENAKEIITWTSAVASAVIALKTLSLALKGAALAQALLLGLTSPATLIGLVAAIGAGTAAYVTFKGIMDDATDSINENSKAVDANRAKLKAEAEAVAHLTEAEKQRAEATRRTNDTIREGIEAADEKIRSMRRDVMLAGMNETDREVAGSFEKGSTLAQENELRGLIKKRDALKQLNQEQGKRRDILQELEEAVSNIGLSESAIQLNQLASLGASQSELQKAAAMQRELKAAEAAEQQKQMGNQARSSVTNFASLANQIQTAALNKEIDIQKNQLGVMEASKKLEEEQNQILKNIEKQGAGAVLS